MNPSTIQLIGCGGVASHLMIPLLQTAEFSLGRPDIFLWDGDEFERGNASRQMLAAGNVGRNKAEAFADHYRHIYAGEITAVPRYFSGGGIEDMEPIIVACVDNHAARRYAREAAIARRGILFSAANETRSGEAWVFRPRDVNTVRDPWVRYPDLWQEVGRDPSGPMGCMSDAAISNNPQLPVGNAMSAMLALWLIANNLTDSELNPAEARYVRNGLFCQRFADFKEAEELVAA